MTHKHIPSSQDKQAAHSGKVENDTNKLGKEKPTQKNEGRRTPSSRSDREDQIGSNNQSKIRKAPSRGHTAGLPRQGGR